MTRFRPCCENGLPTTPPQACRQRICQKRKSPMNNTDIRNLYGLKYNPFLPDLPPEALYVILGTEPFGLRVQSMAEHD